MWPWLNKKRIEKELKQKWKRIENVLKKMSKKKREIKVQIEKGNISPGRKGKKKSKD